MNPRHWLRPCAIATTLVLAVQISASLHATAIPSDDITSLPLRLAASKGLSPTSRKALITEAAAIWRRSGVDLHWLTSEAAEASLRVMATPQAVATHSDGPQWTLGELLRFDDRAAIAVVSIAGAQRIADENQHWRLFHLREQRDYRLGVILGRAVAHEVGHYLLRTSTHSASGLMRATIDVREFADVRSAFQLDPVAQAYLARLAAAPLSEAPVFSYPSR
jgi:hypothetical protein